MRNVGNRLSKDNICAKGLYVGKLKTNCSEFYSQFLMKLL